jgi:glycosyltransferase involved in cell wall biosynthesis
MSPRPLRILLVANYVPDAQQSMKRYAEWLERSLSARGYEVMVVRPEVYFSRLSRNPGLSKYLGYIDKFLIFPARLRRLARTCDLVHVTDHSNSMYLRTVRATPCLITCHDLLAIRAARGEFSEVRTGWSGKILQRWILAGLRAAPMVLCVSAKTASDLRALAGKTSSEILVIRSALNWSYRPGGVLSNSLRARLGLDQGKPYLLHVGGDQWYKNRPGAVRIFAQLIQLPQYAALRLVLAGKPWTTEVRALVTELGLQNRVLDSVGPDNEELQALYGNALALLFPSLEEGFGWPILEAQACGCPVITTGCPPMSEVAGDAAIYIDPANPAAAAQVIAEGLVYRERLRAAGFRNLERFREADVIDRYCVLYEAAPASPSAPAVRQ